MEKKQNGMIMRQNNYKLFIYLLCLCAISCSSNELSYYERKRYNNSISHKKSSGYVSGKYKYDDDSYGSKYNNNREQTNYYGDGRNEIIADDDYEYEKPKNKSRASYSSAKDYHSCGGGYYKIGKPYKIGKKTYYPKKYKKYIEYGLASWYGDDFHRNRTSNDDIFDMNAMTGAHNTLPLPSIVKVTNLENGKSQIIRINDRGPFVEGRIVDVSKAVATKLGFKTNGLTNVKVEYLPEETEEYLRKCGYDTRER